MVDPNLINLLPHYFRKIKDFIALMETEDIELGQLEDSMQQVYDNFFIQTSDSDTIRYHEKLLGIITNPDETLEFRRLRVLNRYNNRTPLTIVALKDKLNLIIGIGKWELNVDYANYVIHIKINAGEFGIMDEMTNMLVYTIPAHIEPDVLQELHVDGIVNTCVAAAFNPAMRYFLTQDINEKYRPTINSKAASAMNPMMRYMLTQDIKTKYQPDAKTKVGGVVNSGTTYRLV